MRDSELVELRLLGKMFENKPMCWQNMINHLMQLDQEAMWTDYLAVVNKLLNLYNLELELDQLVPIAVKGTQPDLTVWMLTYG
jgi:hypothetical protein